MEKWLKNVSFRLVKIACFFLYVPSLVIKGHLCFKDAVKSLVGLDFLTSFVCVSVSVCVSLCHTLIIIFSFITFKFPLQL